MEEKYLGAVLAIAVGPTGIDPQQRAGACFLG
jgi:hypothetical protein